MSSEAPAEPSTAPTAVLARKRTSASGVAGLGPSPPHQAGRRRMAVWAVVGFAALIFVWFHRQEVVPMWGQLRTASRPWLLVGAAFVGVWLLAWGLMHRGTALRWMDPRPVASGPPGGRRRLPQRGHEVGRGRRGGPVPRRGRPPRTVEGPGAGGLRGHRARR